MLVTRGDGVCGHGDGCGVGFGLYEDVLLLHVNVCQKSARVFGVLFANPFILSFESLGFGIVVCVVPKLVLVKEEFGRCGTHPGSGIRVDVE